jgi:cellulose synthase/poly-beta-1,6-N-acetylglucosamine synthase-like glycosyltransferase
MTLTLLNGIIFFFSLGAIFLVFLYSPLKVLFTYLFPQRKPLSPPDYYPSVSILTVVHNARNLIVDKIKNSLSLQYPSDKLEIVVCSDGSTDDTVSKVEPFTGGNIKLHSFPSHEGKNHVINETVPICNGDIIIFSDADAFLEKDAIRNIAKNFADPQIGGVCGNIIISEEKSSFFASQTDFLKFDRLIKKSESRMGSVYSNSGKLSAIKKDLFRPLPLAVPDDLYILLSVVQQNYRFIFEEDAKASIRALARNPAHEFQRRQRVVTRALTGIWSMKQLLNPFQYGSFSISLFINKVLRTFLPLFLILLFFSSIPISFRFPVLTGILLLQIAFYLLALSHWVLFRDIPTLRIVERITSTAFYFCLGNIGTLIGIWDFMKGERYAKWEPIKKDD